MRQKVETDWRAKVGRYSEKFRFDDLLNLLQSVIGYEDVPPEKLSVRSAYLLSAYLAEKNIKERIENWEREQELKKK